MSCNILIVDPDDSARDFFHESFASEGFSAMIAEAVNLDKALRFIETENLHYIFLGPNLEPLSIKTFAQETTVCSNYPVIVLLTAANKHFERILIREGITSTLSYPVEASGLIASIEEAKKRFSPDKNTAKPGSAHQLALILSKLALRLEEFSKMLSSTPMDTEIASGSVPLAVNEVIGKVTRLRRGKEIEDLEILKNQIIR